VLEIVTYYIVNFIFYIFSANYICVILLNKAVLYYTIFHSTWDKLPGIVYLQAAEVAKIVASEISKYKKKLLGIFGKSNF